VSNAGTSYGGNHDTYDLQEVPIGVTVGFVMQVDSHQVRLDAVRAAGTPADNNYVYGWEVSSLESLGFTDPSRIGITPIVHRESDIIITMSPPGDPYLHYSRLRWMYVNGLLVLHPPLGG
jgi:hypothetical protein